MTNERDLVVVCMNICVCMNVAQVLRIIDALSVHSDVDCAAPSNWIYGEEVCVWVRACVETSISSHCQTMPSLVRHAPWLTSATPCVYGCALPRSVPRTRLSVGHQAQRHARCSILAPARHPSTRRCSSVPGLRRLSIRGCSRKASRRSRSITGQHRTPRPTCDVRRLLRIKTSKYYLSGTVL